MIFNHGYLLCPGQNTALMEELASRGYVVFSLDGVTWDVSMFDSDLRARRCAHRGMAQSTATAHSR